MLKSGISGFCIYKDTLTTMLLLLRLLDLVLCTRRNVFEDKCFAAIQRWELCVWTAPLGSRQRQAALNSCLLFSNLALSNSLSNTHFIGFVPKNNCFWGFWTWIWGIHRACPQYCHFSRLLWYPLQEQGRKNQAKQLFRQEIFLAAILWSVCVVNFHPGQRQREFGQGVL